MVFSSNCASSACRVQVFITIMFLHLINNDPKFPKSIRVKYEVIDPGNHVYVIVKASPEAPELEGGEFTYVEEPTELAAIIQGRNDWEGIIINGLLASLSGFMPVIPQDLPVAYFIWGWEVYPSVFSVSSTLLGPQTRREFQSFSGRLRMFLSSLIGPRARLRIKSRKVAKRVDVVSFPIREEAEQFISNGIFSRSVQYHCANVGGGTDFDDPLSRLRVTGQNILVGNSAAPTNNHLDTFAWLDGQKMNLSQRQVIVPLSYGGCSAYIERVVSEGYKCFGDSFVPLLEFMPLTKYVDIIRSASCVVMNHYRQQAAGNVFLSLTHGSSVYLHENSTLSKGLKRMGFKIGDINSKATLDEFCIEDLNHNRALARVHFSKKHTYENTEKLLLLLRTLGNRPVDGS